MTPRENLHAFYEGRKFEWKPVATDRKSFHPQEICEYVARAFVYQQEPFDNKHNGGGPGWFPAGTASLHGGRKPPAAGGGGGRGGKPFRNGTE